MSKHPDGRAFFSTKYKAQWTDKVRVRQIRLFGDHAHVGIHHITFPGRVKDSSANEEGWYQQMGVYAGFFEGTNRRNRNRDDLYLPIDEFRPPDAYEIKRDATLPVIEHDCLETFFKHIGYDPIKKKYP
jgi:hypothetical protein